LDEAASFTFAVPACQRDSATASGVGCRVSGVGCRVSGVGCVIGWLGRGRHRWFGLAEE